MVNAEPNAHLLEQPVASNVAPPKNTAGGGFDFENHVCAWLLASMLVGEPIFGRDFGAPVRIDFQTRPDGWFLDDVLVTTSVGSTRHRFALSIKSNVQFTATSAPTDFVAAAWEQWLHIGSTVFDAARDFMGLVTAPLSGAARSSQSGLCEKSRHNDPSLFPARLATPNWAPEDERSLFASFACPAAHGRTTTQVDTARMLQRLRFLQHDFGDVASESLNGALELCRRAVRSHSAADAQLLWSVLCEVASELRPLAGCLPLSGLIDRLRSRVRLAAYPDHVGDWTTLDSRSARDAALVRDSIADRIRLPRDTEVTEIIDLLMTNAHVALLGTSGVGKSALARSAFERRRANGERTLWVDAPSLDRAADFGAFEITLRLQNPFAELVGKETGQSALVIIDGLDRLYSQHAFRNVASLLRVVIGERPTTQWHALAVCQSQEWPRALDELQRAGAPATRWSIHDAKALQPGDLRPVREAVPALGRLLLQPRVGVLFTNLKFLDLVVRRFDGGAQVDASSWVGESSVADWFWHAEIARGQDRLARGQCVRNLASLQADRLLASVPVDEIQAGSLSAAQSLTADQLLVQMPGDRLAFAHDLYGDWVRLRILLNHRTDLTTFLKDRHQSPLWHRAIRLFGIHLLERENGATEWKTLMSSFSNGGMTVVQDLLLEAPAFAMNSGALLNSVFPTLVTGEGALLKRLLTRFLAFATVPDERMLEAARSVGMDDNAARAVFRRPHWPYWQDVLAVVSAHREDALRVAAPEVAKIVEMWLECPSPDSIMRREASELWVMLGRRALDIGGAYSERASLEDQKRFYKCALLAAAEWPDDVANFAKIAAKRVSMPLQEAVDDPPLSRARSLVGTGVMRGPWPDGPLVRVDDAFRGAVLDGRSIQILFRVRPAVAREVILATLIEAPYEVRWGGGRMQAAKLDLVDGLRWHPAFFTHGPFLDCLQENFAEGLELVMRLVEFATERSNEYATQELAEWRAQAAAAGQTEAEIEEAAKRTPAQHLVLHDGAKELTFAGDEGSYGWSAGLTSPRGFTPLPPHAVASALMALEQYFYQHMDAGQDIAEEVATTLQRSRSVASLGVLCDLGKRQPQLLSGPLRALLSAPELYSWELTKTLQGRSHLMIGAFNQGQHFTKLANQFNELGHRKRDLRDVALDCLLKSEEMQTFFATVRDWWKKRRADGKQLIDMADQLDLWLDPANYQTREDPAHGLVIVNVALERVQAERSNERQAMSDQMLVTGFPMHCRTILDQRQAQNDTQLETLWQTWMRVRELAKAGPALPGGEERFGDEYVNAIAGGIAAFLWHDDWLSRQSNGRAEVEAALESFVSSDIPRLDGITFEHRVSRWTWDGFLAETAAMLWSRDPHDARWRRLVAEMVFAVPYAALRLLFARCADHRATLGDDFGRLRRLAIDWAYVRDRVEVLRSWRQMVASKGQPADDHLEGEIRSWIEEVTTSFVDRTLAPLPGDWNRFGEASRFSEIDALRDRSFDSRLMDLRVVRCSHDWLPLPNAALSPEERKAVLQFWRVALDVVSVTPTADLQTVEHQDPDDDEQWVLETVAAVVLQLRPHENAEQFWAPIIDLRGGAYSWPGTFLKALHRCALSAEQTPV